MNAISWVILLLVFAVVGYGVYWAAKKTIDSPPDKPERPQRVDKTAKKKGK